jgi:hypothetical protein
MKTIFDSSNYFNKLPSKKQEKKSLPEAVTHELPIAHDLEKRQINA